jgi:arylsulfatase A-like enzyme
LKSNALVESVDLFPTLCDLSGLEIPGHLHGESLVPILQSPESKGKEVIFARFHDGVSVKTDRYLYTEWLDDNGDMYARMLYDHNNDAPENVNIAEEEANNAMVNELSALLKQEIKKANTIKKLQ